MRQPTRRNLLRAGAVTAVAAGPLAGAERVLAAVVPAPLTRSTFEPLVGAAFRMEQGDRAYTAVLRAVRDLPHSPAGDERRFGLLFELAEDGPGQGTYGFRCRSLRDTALFVVPVGGGARTYEAVVVSA